MSSSSAAFEPLRRFGAAAMRPATRSIFLWSKFDSEYLRKKPRQGQPRRNESTSGRALNSFKQRVVTLPRARGKRPFHHLGVRSGG